LRRCLAKDANRRLHDIADARIELDEALGTARVSRASGISRFSRYLPWIVTAAVSMVAALITLWMVTRPAGTTRAYSTALRLPHGWTLPRVGPAAVSPDGRFVVFSAIDKKLKSQIWIRRMDSASARLLPNTDGGSLPFWSPDTRSIGFFADAVLKTISIEGGSPSALCPAPNPRGAAWAPDGTIIYAPSFNRPLHSVQVPNGQCAELRFLQEHYSPRWPDFLPDGRRFLFYSERSVYLASLDGDQSRKVLDNASNAIFRNNHLLFSRSGTLFAQQFKPESLEFIGRPAPIAERMLHRLLYNAMMSASYEGTLAYHSGQSAESPQIALLDSNGNSLGVLGARSEVNSVEFSSDGRYVALDPSEPDSSSNIWIHDTVRNVRTRLTFQSRAAQSPVWSPDGRRIVFAADNNGSLDLYVKNSDGTGSEVLLLERPGTNDLPRAWSPDGKWIVFDSTGSSTRQDIWLLHLMGDGKPTVYLKTPSAEHTAVFAPKGDWLAFMSDESGMEEIYVAPFPPDGRKTRVSTGGTASHPRWIDRGSQIVYFNLENQRVVSTIVQTNQRNVTIGETRSIFKPVYGGGSRFFDVTRGGDRFVLIRAGEEEEPDEVNLLINWPALLKR
jgi:eukaryotic-like serine/threonine-protein kinase